MLGYTVGSAWDPLSPITQFMAERALAVKPIASVVFTYTYLVGGLVELVQIKLVSKQNALLNLIFSVGQLNWFK